MLYVMCPLNMYVIIKRGQGNISQKPLNCGTHEVIFATLIYIQRVTICSSILRKSLGKFNKSFKERNFTNTLCMYQ
jgi:hypothetical protein